VAPCAPRIGISSGAPRSRRRTALQSRHVPSGGACVHKMMEAPALGVACRGSGRRSVKRHGHPRRVRQQCSSAPPGRADDVY